MSKHNLQLRLAGLGLALLLSSLTVFSKPAAAVNPNGCQGPGTEVIYYSDASLSREVGRYTESCTGVCSGGGRVTAYFTVVFLSCPPPPNPA